MRKFLSGLLVITVLRATGAPPAEKADLLVLGDIYTVDAARTWAEAMAVRKGKIVFVGPASGAENWVGPDTGTIKAPEGAMILPGLVDSHIHLLEGGLDKRNCQLAECKTKEAILAAVAAYAKAHPDAEWILGSGWSLPLFPDANPNKADLDKIVPDRPVWLYSVDGHSAWANSAALRAAGIDASTPEPPRGRIMRDPATGEPTGTFREAAMDLIESIAPKPPDPVWEAALRDIQKTANEFGLTMIQEANMTPRMLGIYHRLAVSDALTLKVVAAQSANPAKPDSQVEDMIALRDKYTAGKFSAGSAKIFADGGIEGHTAALLEPYADDPEKTGILNWSPEQFASIAKKLDRAGFQMHIHAIGDRAVREALNAIEAAQKENGRGDNRHHIAHLEMIAPEDLPRFRSLGVVANFQPFWAFADDWIVESTNPLIGPERAGRLYQIETVIRSGAVVAAGSDWTVSTMNPFAAIQVGMTRQPLDNPSAEPWIPAERASLSDLLAAYTINGAYVNHRDQETGSLEVGKAADFIVIDRNLFEIPATAIGKTQVLRTFLDGKEVYTKDDDGAAAKDNVTLRKRNPGPFGCICCRVSMPVGGEKEEGSRSRLSATLAADALAR